MFLAFPLSFLFEQGGNSLAGPLILHTSSNAPALLFVLDPSVAAGIILPWMGVVLVSIYLSFLFRGYLDHRDAAAG